jgi:hypothetical protein
MSRLVELKPAAPAPGSLRLGGGQPGVQQKIKDYGERVAKFVPVEVLAFYTGAVQLVLTKEGSDHATFRLWTFGIVGMIAWIGTPLYLGMFSKNGRERRINQIVASVAFIVWAYAYPAGWFAEMGLHEPVVAGLALLTFTFVSGFYQPKEA